MKLADFMDLRGLSDEALADLLGCTRVTVSRLRRETARPSWGMVAKVASISNGAVTANDFLPPRLPASNTEVAA